MLARCPVISGIRIGSATYGITDHIMLVLEGAIATAQIDDQAAPMVQARRLIATILARET